MKKILALIIAVTSIFAFCACGESSSEHIHLKNSMGEKIDSFYISDPAEDEWGESVIYSQVGKDDTVNINIDKIPNGPGEVYDICAVTSDGVYIEVYSVTINTDDTIEVSYEDDEGLATITTEDGDSTDYIGYVGELDE